MVVQFGSATNYVQAALSISMSAWSGNANSIERDN